MTVSCRLLKGSHACTMQRVKNVSTHLISEVRADAAFLWGLESGLLQHEQHEGIALFGYISDGSLQQASR